jgi:hypothetical protein
MRCTCFFYRLADLNCTCHVCHVGGIKIGKPAVERKDPDEC